MFGLPTSTEIRKLIPKKKVYEHFGADMSADRRKSFDADIARITLLAEISPVSLNLADGADVHSVFVVLVGLKRKDFDKQNIAFIARMFGQRLVLVLEYGEQRRLALWQTKLMMNDWAAADSVVIPLSGQNMDVVWQNVVGMVSGIALEHGRTLDEQIAEHDNRVKLVKEIARLEKLARAEKQPKKKFELVQQMRSLQKICK